MTPTTRPRTPAEELARQRVRAYQARATTARLTRLRATNEWLVEGVHEDYPQEGPVLLDYDPWDDTAQTWGPDAPQRYATEAEALDRVAAECAHPGSDWLSVQVRHQGSPVPSVEVSPTLVAGFAGALGGAR